MLFWTIPYIQSCFSLIGLGAKIAMATEWGQSFICLYSILSFISVLKPQSEKIHRASTILQSLAAAWAVLITVLYRIIVLTDEVAVEISNKKGLLIGSPKDLHLHQVNAYLSIIDLCLTSNGSDIWSQAYGEGEGNPS